MPDLYKGKIPIIRRSLNEGFPRGEPPPALGCIPRDFDADPVAMGDSPAGLKTYTRNEFSAICKEQDEQESSLYHILCRSGKPAFDLLDQNGDGYCWSYSNGICVMLDRLKQNLPPVRINPHATAAIIKRGRDEGGWCGLSYKFGDAHGWAVEGNGPGQWPRHSRDLRHDTPELRANMALHRTTEGWYDLGKKEYDQGLTVGQLFGCSQMVTPMSLDYNIFAHSMCGVCVVEFEPGAFGPMVFQSWNGWGWHGLGILAELWPDNAVAMRATNPSVK